MHVHVHEVVLTDIKITGYIIKCNIGMFQSNIIIYTPRKTEFSGCYTAFTYTAFCLSSRPSFHPSETFSFFLNIVKSQKTEIINFCIYIDSDKMFICNKKQGLDSIILELLSFVILDIVETVSVKGIQPLQYYKLERTDTLHTQYRDIEHLLEDI